MTSTVFTITAALIWFFFIFLIFFSVPFCCSYVLDRGAADRGAEAATQVAFTPSNKRKKKMEIKKRTSQALDARCLECDSIKLLVYISLWILQYLLLSFLFFFLATLSLSNSSIVLPKPTQTDTKRRNRKTSTHLLKLV